MNCKLFRTRKRAIAFQKLTPKALKVLGVVNARSLT